MYSICGIRSDMAYGPSVSVLNLADHAFAGAIDVGLAIVESFHVAIRRGPIELQSMGDLLKLKVDLLDGDRFRTIRNPRAVIMLV